MEKNFIVHNITIIITIIQQRRMILSYAKSFNEKVREQLAKIWKKENQHASDLSTLSIGDIKINKKINQFSWYKSTLNNSKNSKPKVL